jgi:hypothetical protein
MREDRSRARTKLIDLGERETGQERRESNGETNRKKMNGK